MKKFFDAFILKSIWRQVVLAVLIIVVIVIGVTPIAQIFLSQKALYYGFHSSWLWGLLHLCDGGTILSTIVATHATSDETAGVIVRLTAIILWLIGLVLLCFLTSAFSNAFEVRKTKVASGLVRYKFSGGHGIIIGWDFQGVSLVLAMKELYPLCKEIVILSSQAADKIRGELENVVSLKDMKNIFFCKGNVFDKNELKLLTPWEAGFIVILGDQNEMNNDGGNSRIFALLPELTDDERKNKWKRNKKVPCFIDISNPYNIWQREFNLHSSLSKVYLPRVLNFYKQSVLELLGSIFSIYLFNKGFRKGAYEYDYVPLDYRRNPEATHVHILISGFDDMAHMYIVQAIQLLQPSKDPHKISIFSDKTDDVLKFMDFYAFELLHNVKIDHYEGSVCSKKNRGIVSDIVKDMSASVTLLLANPSPAEAMEEFHRLPEELNFENIHIIIEQQVMTSASMKVYQMRRKGYSAVDYIGLIDKFYYSLLKQDELIETLAEMSSENPDKAISHRKRDDMRRLADSLLEKFYRMDLEFDMIVREENQIPLKEIPHMEELAKAEHMNLVNHKILSGNRYSPVNDDRHFFSDLIKPWDELTGEQKNFFYKKVSVLLPTINAIFGEKRETYPYSFVQHKFRCVCGFIDNSEAAVNWYSDTEADTLYQELIRNLKRFLWSSKYQNREYKTSKCLDRYPSLAILCTMKDDANAMFIDMANREKIPVVAILPQKPEQYQYHFQEGRTRDEFWRRLRNVFTYYVIPDNVLNPKEFTNEVISKYADEIWHFGRFELTCDTDADLPELSKYIQQRSSKPLLRKIQGNGTLVPPYPERIDDTNKSVSLSERIKNLFL